MAASPLLSRKAIDARERLIVPLDVPSNAEAMKLVERLGDAVHFYKVGLELILGGPYLDLVEWLVARDKQVFVDAKVYDVPETTARAVRNLKNKGVSFVTVHGHDEIYKAAV